MYAHKGRTKRLKRHGLHGFALDQPSINGIGPINRSEKGNGRKRSETWSGQNLSNPHFLKKNISAQRCFFFWRSKGVQGETVGNSRRSHLLSAKKTCFYIIFKHVSWTYATKQLLFCRAKVRSPSVSNRFPLDTFGPSKKKLRCAEMFFKEMRVGQVLAWSCFRLFPTVSDRFRPFPTVSDRFIFSERLIGPIPFMEGWSSANPCKPWRLSFFVRPLCAYTAPNIASWPWYPIFPKNHKIPGAREI